MRFRVIPFRLVLFGILLVCLFLIARIVLLLLSRPILEERHLPQERKSHQLIVEKSVYLKDKETDQLTVFSAFRETKSIILVLSSFGYFQRRVYCRYFDSFFNEIFDPEGVTVFPEFLVHCPEKSASFITATVDKRDKIISLRLIEIKTREKSRLKYNFSVCLAPIYGNDPKWLTLLEFIEFYKLQGVDHFYIYKLEVDELVGKILSYYVKKGLIDVIQLTNETGCMGRHRCRHEAQLQECLTRSRGESKFVATVDLDERILPSKNTILSYIESHSKKEIAEFRFRCQWVLRYVEIPTKIPESWEELVDEMPTILWHNTSHFAPLNHTTKSVIDPLKVESMGVHQVLRFSEGSNVFLVPPEEAVVRHYRLQKKWSFFLKEAESFGEFAPTSIQKSLENSLKKNIRKAVCLIFNKFCR